MKYKINPLYKKTCTDFLLNIQKYFNKNQSTIHKARNELKTISCNTINTVVKSFQVPNFFRRILYTYFRKTKAKKSYENSIKIGNFTPNPIGYIEFYKKGLLNESYFIAQKFEYDFTIREPLTNKNFKDKEKVFKAFARFTFALHQNNIIHKDYSPGNILIKEENNNYTFKVVDINRMKFKVLSVKERLQNFNMLWAQDEDLTIIIKEYATIANIDKEDSIKKALYFSQKLKNFKNMKKRLKGKAVVD